MPSTVIANINYDHESGTLEIKFLSGAIYHYLDVPEKTFNAMMKATSKGIFLNKFIKGIFRFKKINAPDKKR